MPPTTLVGRRAPDFELPCTASGRRPDHIARLKDYRDRWLILMFYPHDFSLVCPTELSAMNNRYAEFAQHNADILAVSTDSIESHNRWITTAPNSGGLGPINFPLASDPTGDVARAFHVFAEAQLVALRGLVIIDPNSVVQYQLVHNLSTGRRADEILRVLTALQMGGLCPENWSPGRPAIDPADELKNGNVISHYRIEEKIGEGAFATVYRAFDRVLRRDVALKILRRVDDRAPSIHDEARAAAALNHPNVCTIYGIDDGEGVPIIVMEYLGGRTLKNLIADGPATNEFAAGIARQIAGGMSAAHNAGVLHGDLKPANIIISDEGTAKILDFGLAQCHERRDTTDSTASIDHIRNGSVAGTPSYMSPEQAQGAPATPATDVFAFGVILYELLTGKRAFGDENVLQILTRVRSIKPSALADAVDEPFRGLLRRMLVPDPDSRIITMHEIEHTLEKHPISAKD